MYKLGGCQLYVTSTRCAERHETQAEEAQDALKDTHETL